MFLDHNAGGRVRPEVAERLSELLRSPLANPSSLHAAGRRTRALVEEARESVAELVGAHASEVVFTSGGTEANNLAILGAAAEAAHLVSTSIEHASVLRALEGAEAAGATVSILSPGSDGAVAAGEIVAAIRGETALVSIGWVNGEIGVIQPIGEIVRGVRAASNRVRVHADAVQAIGLLDVDVAAADLDLASLSGHKIGAPAGVGALVLRRGTTLRPLLHGGPHERERRSGTENVLGIVGFGLAARLARTERAAFRERAAAIKTKIGKALAASARPAVRLDPADAVPGTLSVSFPDLRGDALAAALDLRGVAVSTGSACAAGAPEPSHVLRALGCSEEVARGTIRLSFGPELSLEDAEQAARIIVEVVGAARARRQGESGAGRAA
ncbi:MAG: cysteine desulfurase [Deltaproteobacteria bacterium]|nr:cysteine desulfurase [Deltaproteobacteria bacterium]